MALAIIGFVFPSAMHNILEESFTDKIIHTYREDPDLQNFIDFAQQEVIITIIRNSRMQIENILTKNSFIFFSFDVVV